jgi:nitroreductase
MAIEELIRRNRTFRRFHQQEAISNQTLRELVDLARLSASAANKQPLKYYLSSDAELNARIFPTLAWAGYLEEWPGPAEGERPAAYIVVLGDNTISTSIGCEQGIACQNILLGAVERGLGGCIIGSIDRDRLRKVLSLPERYEILLVIALGKPKETVVIEPLGADGSIRYWRSADGTHHVPKRALEEIIIG